VDDMEERDLAAEWATPTTGSATDKVRPPGFVPPTPPLTLSLYCLNEPVGHNLKTTAPQTETVSNTVGTWTTITRKTTMRQAGGRDNKSFDTGRLTLVANKHACLIKEDPIENNRKTINNCKVLLKILHSQPVRKMIPVKYAIHPASKLGVTSDCQGGITCTS